MEADREAPEDLIEEEPDDIARWASECDARRFRDLWLGRGHIEETNDDRVDRRWIVLTERLEPVRCKERDAIERGDDPWATER